MNAKEIAVGSMLSALTILFLYLTLLIPSNTITLLTLSSFMAPIALMRFNTKTAILVYITSTAVSLFLLPLSITIAYGTFFGLYGIIKAFIERLDKLLPEYLFKLLFFNSIATLHIILFPSLLFSNSYAQFQQLLTSLHLSTMHDAFLLFLIVLQFMFLVYDYALTLLVDSYYKYFHRL